jgi:hypothetical protein
VAKWHVRVSKQSCKQGNRLILWGVCVPRHFFVRFFSRFFFSYDLTDRKCLNIHSHLDLKSLSFSTESTNVLLPTPWSSWQNKMNIIFPFSPSTVHHPDFHCSID